MTFRRYELFQQLAPAFEDELVIVNIGFPSQEFYSIRDKDTFFYMLGSMGLSSSIGLGLSLTTDKQVVSIDGDGSVLMNLGTLATIANSGPANYTLLIVDNGAYGSTGDQPTFTSGKTSLAAIARGAGIDNVVECAGQDIVDVLKSAVAYADGPTVIVAKVDPGTPKVSPIPLSPLVIRDRFRAAAVA